jgi:hypothetical protein
VRLPQPRGHASTHVDYPLWRWFQAPSVRFTALAATTVPLCTVRGARGALQAHLTGPEMYCHAWKRPLGELVVGLCGGERVRRNVT